MPTWLSRTLLISLGFILFMMPFHAFVSTWGGTAIGPLWLWKSWKEIVIAVLAFITIGWLVSKPKLLQSLLREPLAALVVVYVALSSLLSVLFLTETDPDALLAGFAMNLRYLGVAVLAYLVLRFSKFSAVWLERAYWFVVSAGVALAIVGILQVLVLPSDALMAFGYEKGVTIAPATVIDDNPDLLRAFATLRGPNDFGAFLILPIVLVVARIRSFPLWASILALSLLAWALLLSGSRSAWIGTSVALVAYGTFTLGNKLSKRTILVGTGASILLAAALIYASTTVPVLRQAVFHSSPGDSSLTEGSTDAHISATVGGIARVAEQPWGCGVGCAGPASYYGDDAKISENYFVQIAEEVGIVGLLLFLSILGLVMYRLYTNSQLRYFSRALLATACGYVAIGLLLHVWSDDPLSITWWMLAGAVIGYNESNTWKKSKNSLRSKT